MCELSQVYLKIIRYYNNKEDKKKKKKYTIKT